MSPKYLPAIAPNRTPSSVIATSANANDAPIRDLTVRSVPRMPTPTQTANTSRPSEIAMNAILSAGITNRYLTTAAICSPATFRLWPERAWLGRRPVPLRFAYGRGGISVADRLQRRHSCQDAACNQRSLLHTRRSAHAVTCAHPVSDL